MNRGTHLGDVDVVSFQPNFMAFYNPRRMHDRNSILQGTLQGCSVQNPSWLNGHTHSVLRAPRLLGNKVCYSVGEIAHGLCAEFECKLE